nr:uncharacterized protein LOC109180813 [Ipomoea trifida]
MVQDDESGWINTGATGNVCKDRHLFKSFKELNEGSSLHMENDSKDDVQQTQPELGDSNVWYEAAGGLKKGGYVFGFGSDTPHYFPEVDQVAWLVAEVAALRGSNQQRSQSTDRADSHESSGVGLDDLGLNDDTQSPTQAQ